MDKKIAVLAGDGIGPEVMHRTLRVLEAIAEKCHHHFDYLVGKIGGSAYDVYQSHCPDETLRVCEAADAVLFGSVGGPVALQHEPKWKDCEKNSILKLRQHLKLSINIRPVTIYPALLENSPLKAHVIQPSQLSVVDCLIFRELLGGLYFGQHERVIAQGVRVARDECVYDEQKISTIAHAAFRASQLRQKRVCSVDKANVLATSQLWRDVMNEIAKQYTDVELTHMLVDNCAMQLVLNPAQFDVIVTENMFGDILSDLASALPGSIGLMPSASLNDQGFGLYEPSGGSAPDIAGKGIANPVAQILSAAMMLRYAFDLSAEAQLIEEAVKDTMTRGIVTRDLAKDPAHAVGTAAFVDAVCAYILS